MTLSVTATPRRIGVFGGAFDPPHAAHRALAMLALAHLTLDELRVFPTGDAWHKARGLSAAHHRLAMAQLAFVGVPGISVDEREIRRSGPTYTVDTLAGLQVENPGATLYLIIGADQARALGQWHRWRDLLRIAIICVAGRGPATGESGNLNPQNVPESLQDALLDMLPDEVRAAGRFLPLPLAPMDVSATTIRERVAAGLGIADLVTPSVARYIAQNHLYLPL